RSHLGFTKFAMESLDHQFPEGLILSTSRHETQSLNSVREYSKTIPDDLLIEIFSRVPATSIARFSCLSKYWASIFSPVLTKSLTRPRLLFTFVTDGKLFFYTSPQPHNPDDNSSLVAIPYPTLYKAVEGGGRRGQRRQKSTQRREGSDTHPLREEAGHGRKWGGHRRVETLRRPPESKTKEDLTSVNGERWGREEKRESRLKFHLICNLPRKIPSITQIQSVVYEYEHELLYTHYLLGFDIGVLKSLWRKLEPEFNFKEDGDVREVQFINKDEDMLPKPSAYYTGHSTLFNYKDN
ncbi:hypothetical protein HID58_057830, partial [Brassica napus]